MDVSREIRHIFVAHHQAGHTLSKIALTMNMLKTTVRNLPKQYTQTGTVLATHVGRCGRPHSLSVRDERALARSSVLNPKLTAREIHSSVGGEVASSSISTIQHALHRQGRNVYRPRKSSSLNDAQRKVRLQWCRKYSLWDVEQWMKVKGNI
jgi:transposase